MTPVETIVVVVGILVVLLVALWVALPLFGPAMHMDPATEPSERDRWERQKRQALGAIKETDLDFEMGKLSQDDYDRMRARFEARALEAIQALDRQAVREPSPR
jgi:hypothetical protein